MPAWFVILPTAGDAARPGAALEQELRAAASRIANPGDLFAVRSSAAGEDAADASFAGQLESVLAVPPDAIGDAVARVWASGDTERVRSYRASRGLTGEPPRPGVIVQRMLRPETAGVAFGADPVSGDTNVAVVSSVRGLGNALVSGEADADLHRVRRDGTIVERRIARKERAEAVLAGGGTGGLQLSQEEAAASAVTDEEARAIARLAWRVGEKLGRPQDIEWAFEKGKLWLLQARPITTLASAAVTLWDNSNIAESYAGVTTPLTFTFARNAYAEVYRETCKLLLVPARRVAAEKASFDNLLGLIDGRMYYNLVSWYRILAVLPGFEFNRSFMEQMMGVKEELPADLLAQVRTDPRAHGGRGAKARSGLALLRHHVTLDRQIRRFMDHLDEALGLTPPPDGRALPALARQYRQLERALLRRWDAPLLNDFFAMIFFGALRRTCTTWIGDEKGTIQNALLCDAGATVSAEPPERIGEMAQLARRDPRLAETLRSAPIHEAEKAVRSNPELARRYDAYLQKFGDRCLQELKLESPTLRQDPTSLLRTIGEMTSRKAPARRAAPHQRRESAHQDCRRALRGSPLRRAVFEWVLRNARARVRDRENLRFERTRVFGRVRGIFAEMGRRLAEAGTLEKAGDVFHLELDELMAAAEQGATAGLRERAIERRKVFSSYRSAPAPPDRFLMRGNRRLASPAPSSGAAPTGEERVGTGCCPGVVRGRARVVLDPRGAVVRAGEILVARHTDPGWILLFGAAQGLVVEHGSLLSHAAIVSREMGIPSVVGVGGVTGWLRDGDLVELDGERGLVRRLDLREATI